MTGSKLLRIRYNKIDWFIRIYDGTRYLRYEIYDAIYHRISYPISLKSGIVCIFSHHFTKIKVDSNDSLYIEKTLTLHNVIILIKLFLNKDKNHYNYNIFLGKCSHQLGKTITKKFSIV